MPKYSFTLAAACFLWSALPATAQIEVSTGSATIRTYFNGQLVPGPCNIIYSSAAGTVPCHGSYSSIEAGTYTLESFDFPIPPVQFTVTQGQNTNVSVEVGGVFGVITGTVVDNGQAPNPPVSVIPSPTPGYSVTTNTGRFRFLAVPGAGTARVQNQSDGNIMANFSFSAVAGTELDIGNIAIATIAKGNVTVRTLFNGQPIGLCNITYTSDAGAFSCNGFSADIPAGTYTLTSPSYPIPAVPFTVTAGQTTNVNVEVGGVLGVITGTVSIDGQTPNPPVYVIPSPTPGYSVTTNTGRFRFLAEPGAGTARVQDQSNGNILANISFNAVAGTELDIGNIAITTIAKGNATIRTVFNGQPISLCNITYESAAGTVPCNGSYVDIPAGTYTLTSPSYPVPAVSFTVTAGQTTNVNVEVGGVFGVITGTVLINGQVPSPPAYVIPSPTSGYSLTDNTGRFRFLAVPGPGTGRVQDQQGGTFIANFTFNAVVGQVRDLGNIGSTTLNGAIVGRSGPINNKTWIIRLSNTGSNTANGTLLTGLALVQTFGPACPAPTILSSFPVSAGLLVPGASADVLVNINFGSCVANARFTATLFYSANGGSVTDSKPYTLQQP